MSQDRGAARLQPRRREARDARRPVMTSKDERHELVDQLDEDAAREALARLQE